MKLFTSDSAVYKRDVGWVGGTSQASGGLGNALSAPACSKAGTASGCRGALPTTFGPWGGESSGGSSLEGLD